MYLLEAENTDISSVLAVLGKVSRKLSWFLFS